MLLVVTCSIFDNYYSSTCVTSKMVLNRKRKTEIGPYDVNDIIEAIVLVEKGVPLRKAAENENVHYGTLYRYV